MKRILSLAVIMVMTFCAFTGCTPKNSDSPAQETVSSHHPDFPNVDTTGMTDLQKAVVLTAESFVIRGAWGQYDDTRLTASKALAYYRWSTGQRQPEDYTSQFTGYSNCAAFVHDLYLAALDLDIRYYTTATLTSGCAKVLAKLPVSSGFDRLNDRQLEELKQEFLDTLQPGDLIVYRYADGNNGHAMCYVGNNMMIHCTGSSYSYENQEEKYEENGCFRYESIDSFWNKESRRYLFNKNSYVIIRPLDGFDGEIPQRTLDRMEAMRGVVAEKTSSVAWTQTVSPGEEVTFTFTLKNLTGYEKNLTVTDTVPGSTTYVSGADRQEGDALSWTVTVPAGETVEVSYTVQVAGDATKVVSGSYVEHVPVNCPSIRVGRTLTAQEQETLALAAQNADFSSAGGIELVSALYRDSLGREVLRHMDANSLLEEVYRYFSVDIESGRAAYDENWPPQWRSLDNSSQYARLVAPGLYGGRNVLEGTSEIPCATLDFMRTERARLVTAEQLIEGDIIIANDNPDYFDAAAWLFTGGELLDLQTGQRIPAEPTLSQLICRKHFAVIRPSLEM